MHFIRLLIVLLFGYGGLSCQSPGGADPVRPRTFQADSLALQQLLTAGNGVYAEKKSYNSFAASLLYYDSAQVLADRWGNRLMQARVAAAKGRVYDAWNKYPQQTIRYFQLAARLYRPIAGQYDKYIYLTHLVAHAYDKIGDSTRTVGVLGQLLSELQRLDTSELKKHPSTAEMALIATEVRNYRLAERILNHLTRRHWIRNDSTEYDYLDHYYLTRSRIDLLGYGRRQSPYVDSLTLAFRHIRNPMDSLYVSENLGTLLAAQGDFRLAYQFARQEHRLYRQINHNGPIARMQRTLVNSELKAEKLKLAHQQTIREIRLLALWVLGSLLVVITLLSAYLYRRNQLVQAQSAQLSVVNRQLDEKVEQVQLLNKEIQHRVKNNLSMIYSLLYMQERNAEHDYTRTQLQQARLRVENVAALHDQLIRETTTLDMSEYITTLIDSVVRCYDKRVISELAVARLLLPIRYHLPLALILTEWVTNSLKHAVIPGDALTIRVRMQHVGDQIQLTYVDDGQLPSPVPPPFPNLGTNIVQLLCRQIRAVLVCCETNPYHYNLCFTSEH